MHVEGLDDTRFGRFDNVCRRSSAGSVVHLVAVVHQDEEEVEAAHDGSRQVDILLQTLAAVVAAAHRVGGGQDGGASVECGLCRVEDGVRRTVLFDSRKELSSSSLGILEHRFHV